MTAEHFHREPAELLIGQTIKGVYFIQRKIGGGGMGQVYQAVHLKSGDPIALKVLNRDLVGDPVARERFNREAKAATLLRHPNLVSAVDFGETEDGTVFLAMEYVAGRTLARIIAEESPLTEQRVAQLGAQILAGLAEAHAHHLLHRDLKPANVIVDSHPDALDTAKILDFGIAKSLLGSEAQATLTQTGIICGTPAYMSPEQWSGQGLDERSDLYSAGVILYEALTGTVPFQVSTPLEIVHKYLTERPLPPSERRQGCAVSPDLEALVMAALSIDPADRPASAHGMREALLACSLLLEPAADRRTPPGTVALRRKTALPTQVRPRNPPAPISSHRSNSSPSVPRPAIEPTVPPPSTTARHEQGAVKKTTWPSSRPGRPVLLLAAIASAVLALLVVGIVITDGRAAPAHSSTGAAPASPATPPSVIPAPSSSAKPPAVAPELVPDDSTPLPPRETTSAPEDPTTAEPHRSIRKPLEVSGHINAFRIPYPESGLGILSVTADPSGWVFLDGNPYGEAPREFRLPAGNYRLHVIHPKLGKRQAMVRVQPGKRSRWAAIY